MQRLRRVGDRVERLRDLRVRALRDLLAGEECLQCVLRAVGRFCAEDRVARVGHDEQCRVRDLRRDRLRVCCRRAQVLSAADDERRHIRQGPVRRLWRSRRKRPVGAVRRVALVIGCLGAERCEGARRLRSEGCECLARALRRRVGAVPRVVVLLAARREIELVVDPTLGLVRDHAQRAE